jgi:hypothetical protein
MSEYQYYEFRAIDQPLTAKDMSELRSYSTRARITPTSFINDYAWGRFKGDEDEWMDKYFDAFLYLANWGTHLLKLRLPKRLLDSAIAREYCGGDDSFVRETGDTVILTLVSDKEGSEWVEGAGWLSSMVSVRDELARGDLRALYLGWLVRAQEGELEDEEVEPSVPPGLGQLSASLESLAEFLRVDRDLLHAAAATSRPIGNLDLDRERIQTWVAKLAAKQKDQLIATLMIDTNHAPVSELVQRYLKESSADVWSSAPPRRTVGQIRRGAEAFERQRMQAEAEARAKEDARREREAAAARKRHLGSLAGREPQLWAEVGKLIATKHPRSYDQAVKIIVDLRDLDASKEGGGFGRRLETLRQTHARKPSFIERLSKAGL